MPTTINRHQVIPVNKTIQVKRSGAVGHRQGRCSLVAADWVGLAHHIVVQPATNGLIQRSDRADLCVSGDASFIHTSLPSTTS